MNNNKLTISNTEKLNFISNIATMMSAGIPILEIIDSLQEDAKGNTKKILLQLGEDLVQGKHMYASLGQFPKVFDRVTTNIIRASEEAGTLDTTLRDLRDQIKKDMEFMDKIRGAMTYPVLIFFVFMAVMILILTAVVPKIAGVFLSLHVTLPLPTVIIIALSNALLHQTLFVLLGTGGCIGAIWYVFHTYRQFILQQFFRFPLISALVKEMDLTRFSRSMYLMLTSGITITTALDLTQDVVQRKDVANAILFAKETVLSGKDLSEGFKSRKGVFPNIMIKIIEAGEKTGTLDKSMQDISEQMDYQVGNTLKSLTTIIEPLMLMVVGGLVGGMMLSIIAPIYQIIGQVSPH